MEAVYGRFAVACTMALVRENLRSSIMEIIGSASMSITLLIT